MTLPFELSQSQFARIEPLFPKIRGISRADDVRVISGILYVIRNCLQWKDAPSEYGPHSTLRNRFVRWSRRGIFNLIFKELADETDTSGRLIVSNAQLKAHRTAIRLVVRGLFPDVSDGRLDCPCPKCAGLDESLRTHRIGVGYLRNDSFRRLR